MEREHLSQQSSVARAVSGTKWHTKEVEEALHILRTSRRGLSSDEAVKRLAEFGPNELAREKKKSWIVVFLEQFKNYLIAILLVATALSLVLGEVLEAITIVAIVVACAVLGFVEEYRSERALELLKKMMSPVAKVVRDGMEQVVLARELVPGDVVVLHTGDRVPADARLIEAVNLKVDEAPLTGESVPVEKSVEVLPEETPVPDRVNMVFSGTAVTYGRGLGVVTATGMASEFGKIAAMVQEVREEETPLERRIAHIGKWLGILLLSVCTVVAVLGLLRGYTILEMLIWGISLAVAAVPEALPAVVTGALAIGMHEMARRNAIVRKMPAVETLGCASVICADKTGTMTKGEMTVRKIYIEGEMVTVSGVGYEPKGEFQREGERVNPHSNNGLSLLLRAAALCNDAKLVSDKGRWVIRGDTTEGALVVVAAKAGIGEEELSRYPRIWEVPFTSERKRMTTIHKDSSGRIYAFMKGAPEIVLERCSHIYRNGGIEELIDGDKEKILAINERMAGEALRNLAVAYKQLDSVPLHAGEEIEEGFVFLGIAGMIDPPREEVRDAIKLCKQSGIRTVMITGDHKLTAMMVAKDLGMMEEGGIVLTGAELDNLSDEELWKIVEQVVVYARVSPAHKVRIVDAWKGRGYVVAMTGDGVNDAPALKRSDIGVAMGITGTDVTKESSDMILADDNFATIVTAVKEGRRIFDNIQKYLAYLLHLNLGEIGIALAAVLVGLPLPFTAVQILWINLTTDGPPALALGVDPAAHDVMQRPPRKLTESVFTRDVKLYLIVLPIAYVVVLLWIYSHQLSVGTLVEARTTVFMTIIFSELLIALSCRSLKYPLPRVGVLANKFLILAILGSFALSLLVLAPPYLHEAFDVTSVGPINWLVAAIASLVLFASVEITKYVLCWREERAKK